MLKSLYYDDNIVNVILTGKKSLIFNCYFLWKAHSTDQTTITRVSSSGTHFTAESTEAMRIKRNAHRHNILMQPRFEP